MSTPTALYRLYGEDDALLYVGVSKSFMRRWQQHSDAKEWWTEARRATLEWFPDEESALDAERAAIPAEQPRYNLAHLKPPGAAREKKPPLEIPPVERGKAELDHRPGDEDLMTLEEAAEMARISTGRLRIALDQAAGPIGFVLAGETLFRRRQVRQWIADVEASQQQDVA